MALTKTDAKRYMEKLLRARLNILMTNGFFGMLLMSMKFSLSYMFDTAWTDGKGIFFNPDFLDRLSDKETEYVLMHEIMHVVLKHCERTTDKYGKDDEAADMMNIAADIIVNSNIMMSCGGNPDSISIEEFGGPQMHDYNGREGYEYSFEELCEMLYRNRRVISKSKQPAAGSSDDDSSDNTPNNNRSNSPSRRAKGNTGGSCKGKHDESYVSWDTHDELWQDDEATSEAEHNEWLGKIGEAARMVEITESSKLQQNIPLYARRVLKELSESKVDWRTVLNDFVQQEITDYSFTPPDRRYDGDFFLPDFNALSDKVENILFMVDTSGSMSDDVIARVFSEIKGAIDQFDGYLRGWLGFFDADVTPPKPFSDSGEMLKIEPMGGGGTSFYCIFKYLQEHIDDFEPAPACIIILTDGYAEFPDERETMGIPVLWMICDDEVVPPWGRYTRVE